MLSGDLGVFSRYFGVFSGDFGVFSRDFGVFLGDLGMFSKNVRGWSGDCGVSSGCLAWFGSDLTGENSGFTRGCLNGLLSGDFTKLLGDFGESSISFFG